MSEFVRIAYTVTGFALVRSVHALTGFTLMCVARTLVSFTFICIAHRLLSVGWQVVLSAVASGIPYLRANQEFTARQRIRDVTAVAVQVIYRLFVTIRMPVKNTAE